MADTLAVTPLPDWRAILQREIRADKRGKAGVAQRMGVSRCYVSRALGEKSAYDAVPAEFIARVIDLESDVDCPAQGRKAPRDDCRKALGPAPTHNPLAMRLWRDCQTCPLKPLQETKA
jgi:hypothetical protein